MSCRRALGLSFSLFAASVVQAQVPSIDPGMSRTEVIDRLGRPLNERMAGGYTYLFYRNGCERSCGMNDLVILENGKVVDAIFRSAERSYTGTSTSPNDAQAVRSAAATDATPIETVRRAGRGGLIMANPAAESAAAATSSTGGNAPQAAAPGGNAPQVGSPMAPAGVTTGQPRPVLPVAIPGAYVNPADSVRALSPNWPTAIPGARVNPADSIRAEQVRRQQQDTTRRPR
jgi:hypothetical protein